MKVKMEDMAQEFGDMLKETLDRMRERIEVRVYITGALFRRIVAANDEVQ